MTKISKRPNGIPQRGAEEHYGRELCMKLDVTSEQVGRFRRIITAHVRWWGQEPVVDKAVMCATEMMTNVQKHAGGSCQLLLQEMASGVRIVVSDHNPALPTVLHPDWDSESGRGMWLLNETAQDWGAVPTPSGKDVWAVLRADETAA